MLIRILHGTPPWVFVLFVALIALGILQTRTRLLTPARVALLPGAFLAFSLFATISAFGPGPLSLLAWMTGIGAAVLTNRIHKRPTDARWDAAAKAFVVPGSWVPLGLMMTVFFVRYAIAVTLAMRPDLAASHGFAMAAGAAYGMMSGSFLARALQVWASRPSDRLDPDVAVQ